MGQTNPKTIPPTSTLCTRESLSSDLRAFGVQKGDTILVHSSIKSLGWVNGGPEALALALLDALGDDGTLVVPTHSIDNTDPSTWTTADYVSVPEAWWPAIRQSMLPFDPRTTPSRRMGAVPEVVRSWPGALRSAHPQTSFAAVGPKAAQITQGHALNCRMGEQSPLARLEEVGAKVLLLGVKFDKCTLYHLAENRTDYTPTIQSSFAVTNSEGKREWMSVADKKWGGEDFAELGQDFCKEKPSLVTAGRVANADCYMFPVKECLDYAESWLKKRQTQK